MSKIASLFVTRLYRAQLSELGDAPEINMLENSCLVIAEDDEAGQKWCEILSTLDLVRCVFSIFTYL